MFEFRKYETNTKSEWTWVSRVRDLLGNQALIRISPFPLWENKYHGFPHTNEK